MCIKKRTPEGVLVIFGRNKAQYRLLAKEASGGTN